MGSAPTSVEARSKPTRASGVSMVATALLLAYVAAMLGLFLPPNAFSPVSHTFFFSLAVIGVWRYSWWGLQAIRAFLYTRRRFPRHRRAANAIAHCKPAHIYALVTSYKIDPKVTWAVYDGLLRELAEYGVPATVVAAVSDGTDVDVLTRLARELDLPDHVELVTMFQDGSGKRSAMAEALRAISRRMPSRDSVCIFMDGDCRPKSGTLDKVLPFFRLMPDVGAVTVNNRGITAGGNWAREWYDLRFAQRHLLMSSLSLSRRLLVITGRFSVIRARLATDPTFIEQIENDHIEHWRLGRFKFLSGDDKSTWFWLLKNGWRMLYVPDARADSFEELPRSTLLAGSVSLMKRWFGNMLRVNGKAIALGPRRVGAFVWWTLIDQRISMWTALVGPTVAVTLSFMYHGSFMLAYALWVLMTRSVLALGLGLHSGRIAPHWPFLLFFNQVVGAVVKTYVAFRLNHQVWTRQKIALPQAGDRASAALQRWTNTAIHTAATACFLIGVFFYAGLFTLPDTGLFSGATAQTDRSSVVDTLWLEQALAHTPNGVAFPLPKGRFRIGPDIAVGDAGRAIVGAGAGLSIVELTGRVRGSPANRAHTGRAYDCPADGVPPVQCRIGHAGNTAVLRNLTVQLAPDRPVASAR